MGVENFFPSVADDDVVNWGRLPFAPPLFWIMKWLIIERRHLARSLVFFVPAAAQQQRTLPNS